MSSLTGGATSLVVSLLLVAGTLSHGTSAQEIERRASEQLSAAQWQQIDSSVERGLRWLAAQQQRDGSFPTLTQGQPGVTSLCVMAFLAHGHMPGEGPYGEAIQRAVDFILRTQKPSGLLAVVAPVGAEISRNVQHPVGTSAVYNHALSSLALSEAFSMSGGSLEDSQSVIEKAMEATLTMQRWPKRKEIDNGGWRYLHLFQDGNDADLSITGWMLMSLRSAKNAGFDVDQQAIQDAVEYVRACSVEKSSTFSYIAGSDKFVTRAMAGAGVLALAHAGYHDSPEAQQAGNWLLREGFPLYNEGRRYGGERDIRDRYHYGVFCACQAMYQLGDEYWNQFYPPTFKVILDHQETSGAWAADSHFDDGQYGTAYTTALMTLTLGASNQLLPIFQR